MKIELQEKYNQLQKQMELLNFEIKEKGFYVEDGKIEQDRKTIGLFWEVTHIYDYSGDDIYMCTYSKNAAEITQEQLKTFITALKEKDFETSSKFLKNIMNVDSDVIDLIEEAILDLDEITDDLEIEINLDSEADEISVGQILDNSTFSIRKCLLSDIKSVEELHSNTTYCA